MYDNVMTDGMNYKLNSKRTLTNKYLLTGYILHTYAIYIIILRENCFQIIKKYK